MTFKNGYLLFALLMMSVLVIQIESVYAAIPEFEYMEFKRLSWTDALTSQIKVTSANSTAGFSDAILIAGIAIDDKLYAPNTTQVLSVTFGPDGLSCPGAQSFEYVPNSNSTFSGEVSTQFWYLKSPQSGICNTNVQLSNLHGGDVFSLSFAPATAVTMLYSGVDQTNPFLNSLADINTGFSTSTSVIPSGIITGNHTVVDIFAASAKGLQATADFDQQPFRYKSSTGGSPFVSFKLGLSEQSGALVGPSEPMIWSLNPTGGVNVRWTASVIVLSSCDIAGNCSSSGGIEDENSSCSGDCTPPTLGMDFNGNRLVSDGFSFNGNFVDVELYYTPYPLITAYVGEENTISLVVYENSGPQNIEHVGLAFGLGSGETFNESKAVIHWERTFDGIESVDLYDPENALGDVRVDVEERSCELIGGICTYFTIYHTFREPLEFNMVGTNIWDLNKNAWQNYFNHGIEVSGDSLNPPKQGTGIFKGKTFQLTQTETNKSIDANGDMWTFDKGIWNKDYVPLKKVDPELTNTKKLWAINYVQNNILDDASMSVILDRNLNYFIIQKEYQELLAESILEEMCPKCLDESFEEIDDIFYYAFPEESDRLSSLNSTMIFEMQRANNTMSHMFSLFYPGMVND